MGCIEPREEPGNCPVCGMKLVEVKEHREHKHDPKSFFKKFLFSLILTLITLFISFSSLSETFKSFLLLIFSSAIFFYGGLIFIFGSYAEIKSRNPGMMTLISLAIISAYSFSFLTTLNEFLCSSNIVCFGFQKTEFFLELNSLITVMLLGHYLEMRSVSSAQKALEEIEKLLPDKAELESGKIVNISELKVGDIVIVRPGGKIPADGIVIEGKSEVNESMITGESKPVLKEVGSEVVAGSINGSGFLKVKVTKIGEETFLAGIKRLIIEAQKSKSRLQVLADVFAKYLTFAAVAFGLTTFFFWLIFKNDFAFALERLVTILVIACPHALGLAIPLVVAISTSLAVNNGFLIRNRLQLELARKVDAVIFDKTGTLTTGNFFVKEIVKFGKISEKKILQIAASLSNFSQHFISKSILSKAKEENIKLLKVKDFETLAGMGIKGKIGRKTYYLGGDNLLRKLKIKVPKIKTIGTIAYLVENKKVLGAIVLEDKIREESKEAIKELKKLGVKVLMVTGDKKEVAEKVARELDIDEYYAEVLPKDKVEIVKELQKKGLKVMMVGDGINDAPSLIQADVGVAIGAGTNVAIESAGIILVRNNPKDIVKLIKLSRATYRKMIENLFWASGYNIIAIPLASGIFGIVISPSIAAILMSLSTIIVSLNALRLKAINI